MRQCSGTLHCKWKNDLVRVHFIAAFSVKKWKKSKTQTKAPLCFLNKETSEKHSATEESTRIHKKNDAYFHEARDENDVDDIGDYDDDKNNDNDDNTLFYVVLKREFDCFCFVFFFQVFLRMPLKCKTL